MEALFFIVIIVVVINVVAIGILFWRRHRPYSNWKALAHELGLQYIDGELFDDPSMYGTYRGAKVNVQTEVRGTGKNAGVYTVVETPLSALVPGDLEVYLDGFFQKVGKRTDGQDIQVGDAELDSIFVIKGVDRDRIRDLLTHPKVKSRLLSAQKTCLMFRIGMGSVRATENGLTSDTDELKGYIRTVVALANALEEVCQGKPHRTPQPQPQLDAPKRATLSGHPARQEPAAAKPAEAGLSTVLLGRPAASGAPADEQTSPSTTPKSEPDASRNEPERTGTREDDWW